MSLTDDQVLETLFSVRPETLTCPAYSLSESEFLQRAAESHALVLLACVEVVQRELVECRSPQKCARLSAEYLSARRRFHRIIETRFAPGEPPALKPEYVEHYRKVYRKIVVQAQRSGKYVPPAVLLQPGILHSCRQSAAYEKARRTAASPDDASNCLRGTHGVFVKRQDGKALEAIHVRQVAEGLDRLFALFGDLSRLLARSHLTIVHTNGKRPFAYSSALGLYYPNPRMITVGTQGDSFCRTLAHEIGHWLDHVSGRQYPRFFSEAPGGLPAYDLALAQMHPPARCRHRARQKTEVWARLVEQWAWAAGGGWEIAVSYDKRPAYWPPESMRRFDDDIRAGIAARLYTRRSAR